MDLDNNNDALVFQCKDIINRDVYLSAGYDSGSDSGSGEKTREFSITLFGSTKDGKSVCLTVKDYRPFFYVRIPDSLAGSAVAKRKLKSWILNGVPENDVSKTNITLETHKTLWDYNAGHMATFYKITVPSIALWRALRDRFIDKNCVPISYKTAEYFGADAVVTMASVSASASLGSDVASCSKDGAYIALKVYEANIDPVLRYFHTQDISPAGWVSVAAGMWDYANSTDATVAISATADATALKAAPDGGMAPYLIASWDIECNSSHGDFPIAFKTWRKPLRELYELQIPKTVDELAKQLAKAIAQKSTTLSPIYLKQGVSLTAKAIVDRCAATNNASKILSALQSLQGGEAADVALSALDEAVTDALGPIAGDEIIQIGTVLYRSGKPVSKHIWVLGSCDEAGVRPPGANVPIHVYSFKEEATMLRAWIKWIGVTSPDVLIGYNIFGFDSKYFHDRLSQFVVSKDDLRKSLAPLSLLRSRPPKLEEKFLSSSAMGDNTMHFISSVGRLQIDLLPYIRRNNNLDSYSLDNVSATFVSGGLSGLTKMEGEETYTFKTKSTKSIVVGRYITLMDEENDRVVDRCPVLAVEGKSLTIHIPGGDAALADHGMAPIRWAQVKDDVSPKDIFRLHRGSAEDRAIIARYCLQDCDLVMELFNTLEVLNNSVAMAMVCSVPVSFIFLRGQGIKAESLVFKECRKVDQLIEVLPSPARNAEGVTEEIDDDQTQEDSYEGAIVLEPHTGIYLDDPVTADDFASLYPSSIISENISHDTLIWVKDYENDGTTFRCIREGSERYDNIPGAKYVNIEFDILRADPGDTRKHPVKFKDGRRVARYIQGQQGTIPKILEMLLSSRKKCRKAAEVEPDEFRKALLDAQQLAYKLTANSLYGQLGSGTFKARRQVLAASTTAYGRKQLMYAKDVIETIYGGGKDPRCDVECVYGDTDSIFLRFRPRDPVTGVRLTGADALRVAKELTIESGKLVSSCLKPPHDFEFDKIFKSFILLSKKRYVGDMSEDGLEPDDFHRKSMGIVMKRRDNAPIVKYVYGGAIERILGNTDVHAGVREAAAFVSDAAKKLMEGAFGMNKLTITKSLRAEYADPTRIAHKVLADRIAQRDPGNKPSTSERIPFVYIASKGPIPKLQGDRIETPTYIKDHALTPDYAFYITNQISKPVAQVFGLAIEALLPAVTVAATKKARDPVAARESLAETVLFEKVLREAAQTPSAMAARGQTSITSLFKKK